MNHHVIIGLGNIAHAHAQTLKKLGEQVSFCSRDRSKAASYFKQYGGQKIYEGLSEIQSDDSVNSCIICLPPYLHEEYVCRLLEAGKNILLENSHYALII